MPKKIQRGIFSVKNQRRFFFRKKIARFPYDEIFGRGRKATAEKFRVRFGAHAQMRFAVARCRFREAACDFAKARTSFARTAELPRKRKNFRRQPFGGGGFIIEKTGCGNAHGKDDFRAFLKKFERCKNFVPSGFEPEQSEPKSLVLPLHHGTEKGEESTLLFGRVVNPFADCGNVEKNKKRNAGTRKCFCSVREMRIRKVVRLEGVEPSSQPWEGHIIAVIRQTQKKSWATVATPPRVRNSNFVFLRENTHAGARRARFEAHFAES